MYCSGRVYSTCSGRDCSTIVVVEFTRLVVVEFTRLVEVKMLYIESSIKKYLEDLSAKLPAPGGGSVAALVGALAAGLGSMVCNFTIGNEKFASQEETKGVLSMVAGLQEELCKLVDEDTKVYGKVNLAYRLPKNTEEEKVRRALAIQKALKQAIPVPMRIAQVSYQLLETSLQLLEIGNPMLITDTGMVAILAYAALESARLNVEINLSSITDEEFVKQKRAVLNPLMEKGKAIKDEVVKKVEEKI